MTVNAFLFSWCCTGIESIIPISQYEGIDQENTMRILKGEPVLENPLNRIIRSLIMRARFNSHRHYEIYAVDCDATLDQSFWEKYWGDDPQAAADLIREQGLKIYSNRSTRDWAIT